MNRVIFPASPVLLVDDEVSTSRLHRLALSAAGIGNVVECQDSREVLHLVREHAPSVILLDLTMPHISGESLLETMAEEYPEITVIVMTGTNELKTAVRCMQKGAFDYIVKPVEASRLCSSVRRAVDLCELRRENHQFRQRVFRDELLHPEAFDDIVTEDPAMRTLFQYAEAIAQSPHPVLITGETGVGKELMARALHNLGGRPGPFVAVNVAGLDDSLFSDTLFGHAKGAFTSADEARGGLLERATGGTLFLDEIGDLSLASQVKLLRLVQEGEYYPLGSSMAKRTDARLIVATHQDLDARQKTGEMRKDLFYRLQSHHIHMPPLRERLDDLPVLLEHLMDKAAASLGKKTPTYPSELLDLLGLYHFPGNVRELETMVLDAVSRHQTKMLSMDVFAQRVQRPIEPGSTGSEEQPSDNPMLRPFATAEGFPTLRKANRFLIAEAMRLAGGNQSMAARLLGISRSALNQRLRHAGETGAE